MNLKIFLTAFISGIFCAFPTNIFGCGGEVDPYDYYISFFSRKLVTDQEQRPFFYTNLLLFYDGDYYGTENIDHSAIMIKDWKKYTGNKVDEKEVEAYLFSEPKENIEHVLQSWNNKKELKNIADSNALAKYFINNKNRNAFEYLNIARKTEALSVRELWSANPVRDSAYLETIENEILKLLSDKPDDFLKERLAFQLCKTNFYQGDFQSCIDYYNTFFNDDEVSLLQQQALSYKAGSYYRSGRNKEAAYDFTKLFAENILDRQTVFMGFLWSTNYCDPQLESLYVEQCKTEAEKTLMLSMFALHGSTPKLHLIKQIQPQDPSNPILPLLVSREVHKMEERYLSPDLEEFKTGDKQYDFYFHEDADETPLIETIQYLESLGKEKTIHQAFYLTAAAHLLFINKEYERSEAFIARAESISNKPDVRDQLNFLKLINASRNSKLEEKNFEHNILPLLEWLQQKAATDPEYRLFEKNYYSRILAQHYHQTDNETKAALAFGLSDQSKNSIYGEGISFLRNHMATDDLLTLYEMFNRKDLSAYEHFMLHNTSFNAANVADVIGTSYMRDHDFKNAIAWLKKNADPAELRITDWYGNETNVDPFYDYVNDYERFDKKLAQPYTKLSLAEEMLKLEGKLKTATNKEQLSRIYYKLASGYYNMSYYGNSYYAVVYYRPTTLWNTGEYELEWEKEYFGVHKAKEYYQKAYELTSNKEFKAACAFLVIKCDQRQVITEPYYYGSNSDSSWKAFKYNKGFAQFQKDFGDTKYFNYVFERCSYLRDFVER